MAVLGDQELKFCSNKDKEQIEFWHLSNNEATLSCKNVYCLFRKINEE